MVKIRLTRTGRKNLAQWRVGVFDVKTRRDGRPIEYLGQYDPHQTDAHKKLTVDVERLEHWLKHGAQPTATVASLIKKAGIEL